jgi:hypothetical protein
LVIKANLAFKLSNTRSVVSFLLLVLESEVDKDKLLLVIIGEIIQSFFFSSDENGVDNEDKVDTGV